jgi:hypothetical protein
LFSLRQRGTKQLKASKKVLLERGKSRLSV